MSLIELFLLAVGLSMDAFAVSVCKGLSVPKVQVKHSLICGAYFGLFQGLMPLLGWLLGVRFQEMIVSVDHWVAFLLLGLIGFNMVREALSGEEESLDCSFSVRSMFLLAVATSIDALAVGVTFAFLQVEQAEILAQIPALHIFRLRHGLPPSQGYLCLKGVSET